MKKHQNTLTFLGVFLCGVLALAQTPPPPNTNTETLTNSDSTTINEVDSALGQSGTAADADTSNEVLNKPMTKKEMKKMNVSDYSNIISETAYTDYSIIQRNYMPKSSRVQIKGGLSLVTNDVFYTNVGVNLGATYHFNETWGLGLYGTLLNSSANSDAQNIKDVQLVNIENLVTVKNTYGAALYYTPIYGKWALLSKRVIPFELYFSGGVAQITNQSNDPSTAITLGAGQLISLGRSSALDVNLNLSLYRTKNINNQDQSNNSLLVTVSYCVFWPQPDYR
ncbi:MAG: outer membrane beta-barrel domain-containing protein [Bdellovibrionaceae bacterium]|nr:outer membrane beta-barrel domain-containing protein [Pseudobdellovibrionaceae bacterium]